MPTSTPSGCSWGSAHILGPLLLMACQAPEGPAQPRPTTNGTVTFHVHRKEGLDRPVMVCLVAAKPNHRPLQNGGASGAGIEGCKEFPAGTQAAAIVAHYAALLTQHDWTAGQDFVAADNSLHFYGISQLGGGSGNSQLSVHGATDSGDVPYHHATPASR